MSKFVLFNGAVLVRPGAYTKIDASQFENVALTGIGIVGLIGEADGGSPRTVQTFRSAKAVKDFYRSGYLVEAAQMACDPGNDPRIPAGASALVCYKVNAGTRSTLVHDTVITYTSRDYGLHTNSIQVAVSTTGANARTITITGLDTDGNLIQEVSPEFGAAAAYGKWTIQYVGAGAACTMTITATTLTTNVTGGPGGENLNITFANYANLNEIIFYIDGLAAYTATALITNAQSFNPANLDGVVAVDIRTALYTVMAHNFDLTDWVNQNSSLITAAVSPLGSTGPRAVLAKTSLAGAVLGTSDNTAWSNAFTAMGGVRINQLVPLASVDAVAAQGTYTIASVLAATTAHCKLMSGTLGRKERQGWVGVQMTKTNLILAAQGQNSEHLCLSGQKLQRRSSVTGNMTTFPEWSLATVLAGMRAGAPLGEPLTHKYLNAAAISNDASWSTLNTDDIEDLLLNGLIVVTEVQGSGFRIERGITTYTKSNNNAFTEESVVQGWKYIGETMRNAMEARYTGRPADLGTVQTVKPFMAGIYRQLRDAGVITDSVVNGVITPGFRNINVNLSGDVLSTTSEVSPTEGINYILNTAVLVPAQFSL